MGMATSYSRSPLYSFLAPALLASIFALSSCAAPEPVSRTEFSLGTTCRITLYEKAEKKLFDAAFARIREIEERMSANREGTEIARLNDAAGIEAVSLSADTFLVLSTAIDIAEKSKGALDPSVGPLVKLWGIGTDAARVPEAAEREAAMELIDYRRILLDPERSSAFLLDPGMRVDLGAMAKGYAADETARILKEGGAKRGLIDLGGNIYVFGKKPEGKPWRIGIQDPQDSRGAYLGIVNMEGGSLVTSGGYERFYEEGGKRYHHILDPASGMPAESGLLSVTVVSQSSMLADCLSTTIFVLGPERGMDLAKAFPEEGFALVDADQRVHLVGKLARDFELRSEGPYNLGQ